MVEADEECERGPVGEEPGAGFGVEGLGGAADFEVGKRGGGGVEVVVGTEDEVAWVEEVVVDFVAEFGGEVEEGAEGGWWWLWLGLLAWWSG